MMRLLAPFVLCTSLLAWQASARAQDADAGTSIPEAATAGPPGETTGASPEGSDPSRIVVEGDDTEEEVEQAPQVTIPHTICQGRVIRQIRVVGNDRVASEDMMQSIRSRRGAPCADSDITRDAHALWDLGYFDDIIVDALEVGQTLDIVFRVRERPSIARITYRGNSEVDNDDLSGKVTLREGAILSIPDVRENVTKLRDLYAEKGFFLARVRYHIEPLPHNEVEVRFDIDEGESVTVRRIRFVGNRNLSSSEILSSMQTSETGFFSFLSSSNTFRREMFDEDVNRLQALYYDRGFIGVHVGTPRVELTSDRRHIDITVPIEEGPRFRIARMRVMEVDDNDEEIEPLGGRRRIRELIDINPGDWFSRTAIARSLLDVTRVYRDAGYARVQVDPGTPANGERNTVDIVVTIRRGPAVHIERIEIRGNAKTRDLVIRREIQIVEGDLYNQTLVELSKSRAMALGFFERVDVSEEDGTSPDGIVLNFEVAERPTGTFQVGAGFSSIESFIFTAQVQQQNLFGLGQSLTLQLQLSGIRQLAQVRLVEPYLFNSRWSAAVEAFKTIRQFQNFNRDSTGGSITFGHAIFTDYLRVFLQYTAEYVDITERTGGIFNGSGNRGINIGLRLPLANLFRDGLTSSLRLSLTWDSRDNRLFPTRGIYASLSSELADQVLGSQNTFIRHRAFFRWYYPLFGGVVLKMNTEAGLITSRNATGVPIFERFFLGGILDVRGFPLRSLGPRAGLPLSVDPNAGGASQGEPFGGNIQLYSNLELEFPILESVGVRGVIFADAGNAWNLERNLCQAPRAEQYFATADPCSTSLTNIRTSYGFGLRWFSPLGPLRFEWGLPFKRLPYESPILFEFTIGNFF